MKKTFVGFGFGPIQSGLFLYEAYKTGNFSRFVVAEVDQKLVDAVRANGGRYVVNIAHKNKIEHFPLENIVLLNPAVEADREELLKAIAESDEIATALPAVRIYEAGGENSVAGLLARGVAARAKPFPTIVYAAENHNEAAELLREAVVKAGGEDSVAEVEFLNTVIGKMSGVISEEETISRLNLQTVTPDLPRAVLVEEFNRILISQITLPGYKRGIEVFQEKPNLLPFEEAKLYGHNAIHALIAYLSDLRGLRTVADAAEHKDIMSIARRAFLKESGGTLIKRHGDLGDRLFTSEGYREYADDLLERMVNPHLNDLVERVGRDHVRKLGYKDRLYGTMRLALEYEVEPRQLALGAAAGVVSLIRRQDAEPNAVGLPLPRREEGLTPERLCNILFAIWKDEADDYAADIVDWTWQGLERLRVEEWL